MQKNTKANSKKRLSFWFLFFLFLIIFVTLGLSFLSGYKKFKIENVNIYGADILDQSLLKENINSTLSGKYYHLFSKKNFLIYPNKYISDNLKSEFKIIDYTSIYLTDINTLQVDVYLREPFALWCQKYDGMDFPKCFFLDKKGFVFSPSPDFSGDAYLKYFGFLPFGDPVGSYFLNSPQSFTKLSDFLISLKKIGISPIYTTASTTNSFEINLKNDSKIFFNLDDDLEKTYFRLDAFLKSKKWISEGITIDSLDYLDLRFGNKIFYKKK